MSLSITDSHLVIETNLSNSKKNQCSPLIYTSSQFVEKIVERGIEFDFELRKQIINDLSVLGTSFSSKQQKIDAHTQYWKDMYSVSVDNDKKYLSRLGSVMCSLERYNIPYVNYLVIFYYFTANEIKNLYRYYFIEWKQIEKQLEFLPENKMEWNITPRDFSKLSDIQLFDNWISFLEQSFNGGSKCHVFFIINKLYQYITPFV